MHFFVYEFVTGGGWYSADSSAPPASLRREGAAMCAALDADLAGLPGARVSVLRDARLGDSAPQAARASETLVASAPEEREQFFRLAGVADHSLVIAPEFDGHLAERTRWIDEAGGRLLGQPLALVQLCSEKHHTAEHLARAGVPVPRGWLLEANDPLPTDIRFPAVIKPVDGAGSLGVRLLRSAGDFPRQRRSTMRVEEFCSGMPASVALLCGPNERRALAACEQRLSNDGRFAYLGGRLPLAGELDRRARRLAEQVAECLPRACGYLGIDLVLGPNPDGTADRVIEINPRVTTSYLGLRQLATSNLAAAMVAIATGQPADLRFGETPVEFAAGDEP